MVLSEAEAEAQLVGLRRQRDALDRSITDLTLYLELGRRLKAVAAATDAAVAGHEGSGAAVTQSLPHAARAEPAPPSGGDSAVEPGIGSAQSSVPPSAAMPTKPDGVNGVREIDPSEASLSDGVLARRHGRALIEAALAVLGEAGRPLHAGEILAVLTGRGFSLPGHDPVAALNTRLWKRSGPGGPLRRMGEAVYALSEPESETAGRRDR